MKNKDRSSSISTLIIFGITSLVLVLLIGLGITIYLRVKPVNENQFTDKLSTQIRLTDSTIGAFLNGIGATVTELSLAVEQEEDALQTLEEFIVEGNKYIFSASITYIEDAYTICYPAHAIEYAETANSEWFDVAQDMDGIVSFSPIYEKSDGTLAIACSITAYNYMNDIVGVATVELLAESIGIMVGDVTTMGNIMFYMLDEAGTIIVDPFEPQLRLKDSSAIPLNIMASYTPGATGIAEESYEGKPHEIRIINSVNNAMNMDYVLLIPMTEITAATNSVISTVFIALIIGLILASITSVFLARTITRPLRRTIGLLRNIAEGDGDLTVRLPVLTNNEFGQLAKYFNQTIEKIANSLKSVIVESKLMQDVGQKLAANVSESAAAINQISANLYNIKDDVSNQNASVEQTNATVNEIVHNIEALNQNISVQSENVTQSASSVEEMVASIRSVTDILEKNQENVQLLQESAEAGRNVVTKTVEMTNKIAEDSENLLDTATVIQSIARETNLLAMNAAIEAAHAGDSGLGFAVVSEEIRKLSENSNSQGKRISDVLKNLRTMIMTMTENTAELQHQFETIFERTQTVSTQESVIKSAMEEQTSGSKQVIDAMNKINVLTADVKASASEMKEGSSAVLGQMEKLAQVTIQINNAMNEISNGIKGLNDGMQEVSGIGQENQDSITNMSNEISKFKVE